MKNKHIIFLAAFGAVAIISILIVQIFWVKAALNINQHQFEQDVTIALRQVAENINKKNKASYQIKNPVKKINESQYAVAVNCNIDAYLLDYYLNSFLDYHNIKQDVEYSIYSCSNNERVYCNYIQKNKPPTHEVETNLPKFEGFLYYFTVSFPHYSILSMHNVPMWVITSIILGIALLFFLYALYIVFEQRTISQVQKDFINNMTHEFKTPISTISVIQQIISDPDIVNHPQKLATYSQIIGAETKRLNDQVERVLHIAKIEKGHFILNKEEVEVHDMIEEIVRSIKAKDTDQIQLDIHNQLSANNSFIQADRVHFSNILHNLLDNAMKYSHAAPKISINTWNERQNIIIEIKDNGMGIDKKDIKRIFEKFYRVPTGNVHNVKGFGLGLYYVSKIIEAHKWQINVESEIGKGTNFKIKIPTIKQ